MQRTFVFLAAAILASAAPQPESFRFVILGDRTGEAQPGIYEHVWQEAAAENPAFVLSVGDTIQGLDDATAEAEWRQVERILSAFKKYPLFLAPGNHDIWSDRSEQLFRKHSDHPPHYSFDHEQVHLTVLDNSRSEQLSADEMAFLESDLELHKTQPVKVIVSHQPSWLIGAMFQNPHFPLHELAKKYGVQYVIAGHIHQMLHIDLEGVTYLSMPSAGGHLRASGKYDDGWFFAHTLVDAHGKQLEFKIEELKPPYGQGRISHPKDWGRSGRVADVTSTSPR